MKQFYILVLFTFLLTNVSAQDIIVKKDGRTIISKVLEVNTSDIKYKKYSNQNGPTFTISKSEIMSINYENGEKDDFNEDESISANEGDSYRLIKKSADKRNSELISLYNTIYQPKSKFSEKDKNVRECVLLFGVKKNSIMSNGDVEMTLKRIPDSEAFTIRLANKTDRTIYIDKGNCFRMIYNGDAMCYYDNSEQTTVNQGGGSRTSVGLGSIAAAFGIVGVVGQLASGINVGGGSSSSVTKTYTQQRIIAIPPHGSKNLYVEDYVKYGRQVERVECKEFFVINSDPSNCGLSRGAVKYGQTLLFEDNDLPWKQSYYVTYSTEADFRTYSTLNMELYIHEVLGVEDLEDVQGLNEYTLGVGKLHLEKTDNDLPMPLTATLSNTELLRTSREQNLQSNSSPKLNMQEMNILNYRFDYSEMRIDGKNPKKFLIDERIYNTNDPEKAFGLFKDELERTFLNCVNNESNMNGVCKLDNTQNAMFEVIIRFKRIDEDGEHKVYGVVTSKDNQTVYISFNVKVDGGSNNFVKQFWKRLKKTGKLFGDKLETELWQNSR